MYEIVKFAFPFADDLGKAKPRPVIVISPAFGKHQQIILAYVTTNLDEILDTDLVLDPIGKYFPSTGLANKSIIRFHRLITITASQVGSVIGTMPPELVSEIKSKIKLVFQLK